jgi:excisionase family DNA binding protein
VAVSCLLPAMRRSLALGLASQAAVSSRPAGGNSELLSAGAVVRPSEQLSGSAGGSAWADPGFLTIREAAVLLRVSESTVRNAIASGRLRAFRFGARGGSIRIARPDLDDYIAGSATKPLKSRTPASTDSQFKHLNASRLLAAWRRQGVFDDRPDGNRAQSSESSDAPSVQRGS